jgi:hypothetical protein
MVEISQYRPRKLLRHARIATNNLGLEYERQKKSLGLYSDKY